MQDPRAWCRPLRRMPGSHMEPGGGWVTEHPAPAGLHGEPQRAQLDSGWNLLGQMLSPKLVFQNVSMPFIGEPVFCFFAGDLGCYCVIVQCLQLCSGPTVGLPPCPWASPPVSVAGSLDSFKCAGSADPSCNWRCLFCPAALFLRLPKEKHGFFFSSSNAKEGTHSGFNHRLRL